MARVKVIAKGPLFNNRDATARKALTQALDDVARNAVQKLEDETPVRTGHMRNSWDYQKRPVIIGNSARANIFNSAEYSGWVYRKNTRLQKATAQLEADMAAAITYHIQKGFN